MPDDNDDISRDDFAVYRRALADAIARSSLRAVALAVGMSPSGLQNLVSGSEPYGKTRERVREWYVRERGFEKLSEREASAVLRRLVGGLRSPELGVEKILAAVREAHLSEGSPLPQWIVALWPAKRE